MHNHLKIALAGLTLAACGRAATPPSPTETPMFETSPEFSLYTARLQQPGLPLSPAPVPAELMALRGGTAMALRAEEQDIDLVLIVYPHQDAHEGAIDAATATEWAAGRYVDCASSGGVLLLARAPGAEQEDTVDDLLSAFAGEE